jgi:acetamidase/formamidase
MFQVPLIRFTCNDLGRFIEICGKLSKSIRCSSPFKTDDISGTAIETPIKVTVKLTVRNDRPFTRTPHFRFQKSNIMTTSSEEFYCVTGIDSDLREATRSAARNMIEFLVAEHGLSKVEAYMLCSVAADLRMLEVVSCSMSQCSS